jgi:hypothetical protein
LKGGSSQDAGVPTTSRNGTSGDFKVASASITDTKAETGSRGSRALLKEGRGRSLHLRELDEETFFIAVI